MEPFKASTFFEYGPARRNHGYVRNLSVEICMTTPHTFQKRCKGCSRDEVIDYGR